MFMYLGKWAFHVSYGHIRLRPGEHYFKLIKPFIKNLFLRFKEGIGLIDIEKRGIIINVKEGGINLLIGKEFDFSNNNE